MNLTGIDHVQLAMPPGEEAVARAFYAGLLGIDEVEKPEPLRQRGGCWFRTGRTIVHLGVQKDFAPAVKAHPAFLVDDLAALVKRLRNAGMDVMMDDALPIRQRCYVHDPFGNRLEFIQDGHGFSQA
jgi:catechol 2,3-dioxygenase-like lactoylglutathione lyase family enzyme